MLRVGFAGPCCSLRVACWNSRSVLSRYRVACWVCRSVLSFCVLRVGVARLAPSPRRPPHTHTPTHLTAIGISLSTSQFEASLCFIAHGSRLVAWGFISFRFSNTLIIINSFSQEGLPEHNILPILSFLVLPHVCYQPKMSRPNLGCPKALGR